MLLLGYAVDCPAATSGWLDGIWAFAHGGDLHQQATLQPRCGFPPIIPRLQLGLLWLVALPAADRNHKCPFRRKPSRNTVLSMVVPITCKSLRLLMSSVFNTGSG